MEITRLKRIQYDLLPIVDDGVLFFEALLESACAAESEDNYQFYNDRAERALGRAMDEDIVHLGVPLSQWKTSFLSFPPFSRCCAGH